MVRSMAVKRKCLTIELALLHAILFHRLFSNIRPATRELFDVTYVSTMVHLLY